MKVFLRNKLSVMTVFMMTSLALVGCNDDNDSTSSQTNPEKPVEVVDPTQPNQNTVYGKLLSYDGQTPIANALVYAVASAEGASVSNRIAASTYSTSSIQTATVKSADSAANTDCGIAPANSLASTCTGTDGSYRLDLGTSTNELQIQFKKGAFSAEQELTLSGTGSSTTEITQLEDTILTEVPKMLVIEGAYDSIELILAKLGLADVDAADGDIIDSKFDIWESTDNLFVDSNNDGQANIFDYEVVFFNCGLDDESWLMDDDKKQMLKEYVDGGGRIYVSDLAYDVVEQTFPEYINYYGSDETPINQPEEVDSATTGEDSITIRSNIEPTLKSWLEEVTCTQGDCLNTDGTVTIDGFASGWARMNGVNSSENVDVYVSGQDSDGTMRPLTVGFDYGSGRVTYTSYHNEEGSDSYCYSLLLDGTLNPEDYTACLEDPTEVTSIQISAQQRILQYLVFEL